MRQQWHRPLKTQKVGIIGTVPERYCGPLKGPCGVPRLCPQPILAGTHHYGKFYSMALRACFVHPPKMGKHPGRESGLTKCHAKQTEQIDTNCGSNTGTQNLLSVPFWRTLGGTLIRAKRKEKQRRLFECAPFCHPPPRGLQGDGGPSPW